MLAGRRSDVDALNRAARQLLRAADRLGPDTVHATGRAYAVGDRIVCLRNDRRLEVTNGTRGQVTAVDASTETLTVQVDGSAARQVSLPARYVRGGHVAHGYAFTVHKAQGATVDRVWVYVDPRTRLRAVALHRAVPPPCHRPALHLDHHPRAARGRPRGAYRATR